MKNTVNQIVNELYEYYGRFGIPIKLIDNSGILYDFDMILVNNKGDYQTCCYSSAGTIDHNIKDFLYWNKVDVQQCGQFNTPLNTEPGKALYA